MVFALGRGSGVLEDLTWPERCSSVDKDGADETIVDVGVEGGVVEPRGHQCSAGQAGLGGSTNLEYLT